MKKEVCKHCIHTHILNRSPHTQKWSKEDDKLWRNGLLHCIVGSTALEHNGPYCLTKNGPPPACLYFLEHMVLEQNPKSHSHA